ncbi:MAG: 16S rRNA (cytidine(1402)-2'-O)-methyltransferase [Terriglobales bacterium]
MATLYLIATPIGNLEDLTPRAARLLGAVAVIACEDTRRTAQLLAHCGLRTPLVSYHEHNEQRRTPELLARLQAGQDVALVSDAGMPLLSDPGWVLVRAVLAAGIAVTPVPGPCALVAALAASGFPALPFYFAGFLPPKPAARQRLLAGWRQRPEAIVCYEAPHRLLAALTDLEAVFGSDRPVAVARELTKLHEEILRGPIPELRAHFAQNPPRGEFTLVLAPAPASQATDATTVPGAAVEAMQALTAQGLDPKLAAKKLARELGLPRAELYRWWQRRGPASAGTAAP